MNWDDLRILLAVSRHGLIARAASELGTDPTTVSRRLQRLEKACGQTLLERHRSGPRLTAAGRRLADSAAAMEAASLGGGAADPHAGRSVVRVSTAEGFGTWFVAEHLASFLEAHPSVHVELVASSGFLSPSRRETDIAILLAKPRRGPLMIRKLSPYVLRLYASRDFLDRAGPVTQVVDLRAHPLVGYVPNILYAPELDYLDEIGAGLSASVTSSSINAQHRLVAAGAGIGVLPCFIGDMDARLVAVLPDRAIERAFWLSVHRDVRERPQVRQFLDWLAEVVARHKGLLLGYASRR
ncbi:LysR family transcriptional regulator [Sphingomonas beigongshangi]|uniref:LysR family transcriptional regulator n=1 Tax=Sphingomonas beigongshangi TaxID=2782540 RepID=UPI00193C7F49|nr:LysR family transcriptional regulator [Sphingomonas beigongshangi]